MIEKITNEQDPRILGNAEIFESYIYNGAVQNYYNRYMSGEKVEAGWVNETDYDEKLD